MHKSEAPLGGSEKWRISKKKWQIINWCKVTGKSKVRKGYTVSNKEN